MLSLDNVFNSNEMEAFDRRLAARLHESGELEYSAEPKLDGVALSLLYVHGRLIRAATRGDGRVGEDVTHTARTIRSIPDYLSGSVVPERLDVRGEAFMPLSAFESFNQRAQKEGNKPLINPRNAAAGALRQLDARLAAQRCLDFFAHGVGLASDVRHIFRQSDLLGAIESWGIKVCPDTSSAFGATGCARYFQRIAEKRQSFDYALDGVVYKLQRFDLREHAGASSRAPRWAVAQKFPAEEKIATVNAIEYQVGRTGALTPVARLEPVFVGGATVRNATLHNYVELIRKDVRAGDTVVVRRAGDVIPEVVRSLPDLRTIDLPVPTLPEHCPECNSKVVLPESEPVARCTGGLFCPAQQKGRILHFASRHAMNIEGLGEQRVTQLLKEKLVNDLPDIFQLKQHEEVVANLAREEPVGEERANKLLRAIDEAKNTTLERFIVALNIPSVGPARANRLASRFKGLVQLAAASASELQETKGVTKSAAEKISSFFKQERNWKNISGLIEAGVNWPGDDIEQLTQRVTPALGLSSKTDYADRKDEKQELPSRERSQRLKAAIGRLADQKSLNVESQKYKWIGQVVDKKFVGEVYEIFHLKQRQIASLTIGRTIGKKATRNLLGAIEKAKRTTLERFIFSLGIPEVGRVTAEALAQHFGSLEALLKADDEQLCQVPDVGEVVSQHLQKFFSSEKNLGVIQALRDNGVNWTDSAAVAVTSEGELHGKSFVLTGTLDGMKRDLARRLIHAAGGRLAANISKNTDYLVAGARAGSKLAKARKFGVKVLNQSQFMEIVDSE